MPWTESDDAASAEHASDNDGTGGDQTFVSFADKRHGETMFLSIGLPSRFAEWCDSVICALVQRALGAFDLVSGSTFEEIALATMRSHAPRLVIGARQPTEPLRSVLAETGRRFVVVLDEPRAALQNLVTRYGLAVKAAVRATAGSCAAMMSYETMPGALVLRADREGRDLVAAASAIAKWFGLEVPAAELPLLLPGHPDMTAIQAERELAAWWASLSARDRTTVDGALSGYAEYFKDARIGPIFWARDLFFVGDDPTSAADRVVDLEGPSRYLFFGPYIPLPRGFWQATVSLAVSKGAANITFAIEVTAGSQFACLARTTVRPQREGVCEATLQFDVAALTDQPIELRVANLEPAFGGRLAFGEVRLLMLVKTSAEIPHELSQALGL